MTTSGQQIAEWIDALGSYSSVGIPMDPSRMPHRETYVGIFRAFDAGQHAAAEAAARELVAVSESDAVPLAILGSVLCSSGRQGEGVEAFEKAISNGRPFSGGAPSLVQFRTADDKASAQFVIQMAVRVLPSALCAVGRRHEGAEVYLAALRRGYPFMWFSPQWGMYSVLAHSSAEAAEKLFADDRARYQNALRPNAGPGIWKPVYPATGEVVLRGFTRAGVVGVFDLWQVPGGVPAYMGRIVASRVPHPAQNYHFWSAHVRDLVPGQKYACMMLDHNAAVGSGGAGMKFITPLRGDRIVATASADAIGSAGASVAGTVASEATGARYRFEYGAEAGTLDQFTAWEDLPPPRTARVRDVVYKQAGHWSPRATDLTWLLQNERSHGLPPDAQNRPFMQLTGPFAQDRNQTNGIGTHDLPLLFDWGKQRSSRTGHKEGTTTLSADGGCIDMRDAELSITVRGVGLDFRGTVLNFWVCTFADDDSYWSEWALTGKPFPDDALQDGQWHTLTLELTNDPSLWTYGGTNPEQGKHANRHRRMPLADTMLVNGPFVLDLALGNERDPARGSFRVFDASARYRSHSALSPWAGAELVEWPVSDLSDPLCMTDGIRGYENSFWLSNDNPVFPLAFTWKLRGVVEISHFQINQHPYWPARDLEVWIRDEAGTENLLWRGTLAEGRADLREAGYLRVRLDMAKPATGIRLNILSGYHSDRCGLDGLEVYGTGTTFTGDGQPCSVSTEISGLTPGQQFFYRTVLEEGDQVFVGETKSIRIPSTQSPVIHWAEPLIRVNNPAALKVRANAMGLDTTMWAELTPTQGGIEAGPEVSIGSQPTARHVYYVTASLSAAPGILKLKARNAAGESEIQLRWPAGQ